MNGMNGIHAAKAAAKVKKQEDEHVKAAMGDGDSAMEIRALWKCYAISANVKRLKSVNTTCKRLDKTATFDYHDHINCNSWFCPDQINL